MSLNLGLESLGFDTAENVSYESLMEEQVEILQDISQMDHAFFDFANTAKDVSNFNEIVTSLKNHASQECVDFASELVGMQISLEAEKITLPGEKQSKVTKFFGKAWTKIKEWIKKAYNWCKKQLNKLLLKLDIVEQTSKNPTVKVHWSPKALNGILHETTNQKGKVEALIRDAYGATNKTINFKSGNETRKAYNITKAGYQYNKTEDVKDQNGKKIGSMTKTHTANDPAAYYEQLLKISILSKKPTGATIKIGSRNVDSGQKDAAGKAIMVPKDEAKDYVKNINELMMYFYDLSRAIPDASFDENYKLSARALTYMRAFATRLQTFSNYALSDYSAVMKVALGSSAAIAGKFAAAKQKEADLQDEINAAKKNAQA